MPKNKQKTRCKVNRLVYLKDSKFLKEQIKLIHI